MSAIAVASADICATAPATYEIPVGIEAPGGSTVTTVTKDAEGVYTINFTGNFGGKTDYTEYEVFTSITPFDIADGATKAITGPLAMLPGIDYKLEFDYMSDTAIDDCNLVYWGKNGGGDTGWSNDGLKGHFPASPDNWSHASILLADRFARNNWGCQPGHVIRLHLRNSLRTNSANAEYGTPYSVKLKNIKYVPVQTDAPLRSDVIPVVIDHTFTGQTMTEDNGTYTLTWDINFGYDGTGKDGEYTVWTKPATHGLLPGQAYNLVFEYKGRSLSGLQCLYLANGYGVGDNAAVSGAPAVPENADWQTVTVPLGNDWENHNKWGQSVNDELRIGFNDDSYTNSDNENYGKPLTVQVRNLRYEPVGAPADPITENITFTAISRVDVAKALQPDGSYDITFNGEFADGTNGKYTEYEAHTSNLTQDLTPGEIYYFEFDYQADDIINQFVGRYWDDTNAASPIIGDTPEIELPATDQWSKVLIPLVNYSARGWGKAGQHMRLHFYNHARTNKDGGKYGQPLNVKVRNMRIVPASLYAVEGGTTGIVEPVITDSGTEFDGETEYYNIYGQRVMNPGKGLYIMRRGSKVSKVIL